MFVKCRVHGLYRCTQTRADPALTRARCARWQRCGLAGRAGFQAQQYEARRVPELVAEIAIAGDARQIEADVAALRGERSKGEAQRVGAVGRNALGKLPAGRL